jgi:hypothetical protein
LFLSAVNLGRTHVSGDAQRKACPCTLIVPSGSLLCTLGRGANPPCTLSVQQRSPPCTLVARQPFTVYTYRPKRVPTAYTRDAAAVTVYTFRPKRVPTAYTNGPEVCTVRGLPFRKARMVGVLFAVCTFRHKQAPTVRTLAPRPPVVCTNSQEAHAA